MFITRVKLSTCNLTESTLVSRLCVPNGMIAAHYISFLENPKRMCTWRLIKQLIPSNELGYPQNGKREIRRSFVDIPSGEKSLSRWTTDEIAPRRSLPVFGRNNFYTPSIIPTNEEPDRTTAHRKGFIIENQCSLSLFDYTLAHKKLRPSCIHLVKCGKFYETYGVDAVQLIDICGLQPMGCKPRAGCVPSQLQSVISALLESGHHRVAIHEEHHDNIVDHQPVPNEHNKSPIPRNINTCKKSRYLSQVLSPNNPLYLVDSSNSLLPDDDRTQIGLSDSEAIARPIIGINISKEGFYDFTEIWLGQQLVFKTYDLTPEGIRAKLQSAGLSGRTDSRNSNLFDVYTFSHSKEIMFLLGNHLKFNILQLERRGEKYLHQEILEDAARIGLIDTKIGTDFRLVENCSTHTHEVSHQPLFQDTARTIGLIPSSNSFFKETDAGVPTLVNCILPPSAPAPVRRFLLSWLRNPRSIRMRTDMQKSLQYLILLDKGLPCIRNISSSKVTEHLKHRVATIQMFRDIRQCCLDTIQSIRSINASSSKMAITHLFEIAKEEVRLVGGVSKNDLEYFVTDCEEVISLIDDVVISDEGSSDKSSLSLDTYPLPEDYIHRNEGCLVGSVKVDLVALDASRLELINAISSDWPRNIWDKIHYDIQNNLVVLKAVKGNVLQLTGKNNDLVTDTANNSSKHVDIGPTFPNGNYLQTEFYTPHAIAKRHSRRNSTSLCSRKVDITQGIYVKACHTAVLRAKQRLRELCSLLSENHLDAIICASKWCLVLSACLSHAENSMRCGWSLPEIIDRLKPSDDTHPSRMLITSNDVIPEVEHSLCHPCIDVKGLFPYWISAGEFCVENDVKLRRGVSVLTGCNESGKSTFLRSLLALCILGNAGLFVPVRVSSHKPRVSRFSSILAVFPDSDRPSERRSSHAQECYIMSTVTKEIDRIYGHVTATPLDKLNETFFGDTMDPILVVVDEFGRGTSPIDASSLTAAQMTNWNKNPNICCIWATHLFSELKELLDEDDLRSFQYYYMDFTVDEHLRLLSYKVMNGVSKDSMGIYTAMKMGLCSSVISRANEFKKKKMKKYATMCIDGVISIEHPMIENNPINDFSSITCSTDEETIGDNCELNRIELAPSTVHEKDDLHPTNRIVEYVDNEIRRLLSSRFRVEDVVNPILRLINNNNPPPSFQSSPCVYILVIDDTNGKGDRELKLTEEFKLESLSYLLYVGETNNLKKRLSSHKLLFGNRISRVLAFKVNNKCESRTSEALLINHLILNSGYNPMLHNFSYTVISVKDKSYRGPWVQTK